MFFKKIVFFVLFCLVFFCFSNYFFKNIKDSKRIWNSIKQIIQFKPPTSHRTIKIVTNNNVTTDSHTIADVLNNFSLILDWTLLAQYQMLKCLL